MLDGIEALMALEKYETVSQAALSLRLTQSAVSKRIHALQDALKITLIIPNGRKLKLTPEAQAFLNKARPLMLELKNLSLNNQTQGPSQSHFSLSLSDSIAGSFGPRIVHKTLNTQKNVKLDLHVHRSLMLLENITVGKYHMGLCTTTDQRKDLIVYHLAHEPLVILHSELKEKINKTSGLITIEENSATWKASGQNLKHEYPQFFTGPVTHVESFLATYQMVKIGLGNGVLPLGLCKELNIPKKSYKILKVTRPISLVTRKTITQLEFFTPFYNELKKNIENYFKELK